MSTMCLSWSEQKRMLTAEGPVFSPCRPTFLPRSSQFCCLLAVPFLLTTVVMHWKREPKSHYISLAVAVAAESHYSSLTVSKRAAELVFAEHPRPPCPTMHHSQEIASYFSRQEVKQQRHPCMCHFLGWEWALVSRTNVAWGAVEERRRREERLGSAT